MKPIESFYEWCKRLATDNIKKQLTKPVVEYMPEQRACRNYLCASWFGPSPRPRRTKIINIDDLITLKINMEQYNTKRITFDEFIARM
jgi:hypothetical protein